MGYLLQSAAIPMAHRYLGDAPAIRLRPFYPEDPDRTSNLRRRKSRGRSAERLCLRGRKDGVRPLRRRERAEPRLWRRPKLRLRGLDYGHHHFNLNSFFGSLSLGSIAEGRGRHGLDHDEDDANERQRKP